MAGTQKRTAMLVVAWAWFLHFLQDVLIFTFMAIGSITPGGQ